MSQIRVASPTVGIAKNKTAAPSQPEEVPERIIIRPAANRRFYAAIFVVSAATVLLELALTRIFDVILWNSLAYLVISSAIFGFGLAGIFLMLWPMRSISTERLLAAAATAFTVLVLLLIPAVQLSPANLNELPGHPVKQLLSFGTLYLFLLAPFFASGLVISTLVSRFAQDIHRLYFWDLTGGGFGCLGIFVLPSLIGGEETLLAVAAAGAVVVVLVAAGARRRVAGLAALGLVVLTAIFANRIELRSLVSKRGVTLGHMEGRVEFSRWDPISLIDVLSEPVPWLKRITYDGGAQSSAFRAFDGDTEALRRHYFDTTDGQNRYNSGKYIALAHWLKRGKAPRVLVIGSAGGQETLAGLAWGAGHVQGVEMVCTVINAAKGPYADFIGHLFTRPDVTATCDEGRSFLRRSGHRYDIIQLHSNHTTSSVANGSGGGLPIYLQTVEAYKEYLSHLTEDGILQINYFVYPRMITTAARAWHELYPDRDFRRHLVIASGFPTMETVLIKRSEWRPNEIGEIRRFLSPAFPDIRTYRLIYAPGEPEARNVPEDFFQVPLSPRFEQALPYRVFPPTDDRPFFRDLRKVIRPLQADEKGYIPPGTAEFMNASLREGFIPMESIHLYVLGGLSVLVSIIILFVPLFWFQRRGLSRADTIPTLVYFGCLGAGFITVELVLMSKFVLLVGFPIYSMATVLFTLLVSAGIGSYLSAGVSRAWGHRGIVMVVSALGFIVLLLVAAFPYLRDLTLGMGQLARILLVAAFLVPIGIPLGMPFPLGIQALHARSPGLIPWAWGVNGFMTVVGSLMAVVLSMKLGFDETLLVALAIYFVALLSFLAMTRGGEGQMAARDGRGVQTTIAPS